MGDEGDVAGRDVAENRRFGIAPSLALGLGTPTRWTFSYFHQNADDIPDYGIPWLFNGPAPVPSQQLLRLQERQLSAHLRRHRNGAKWSTISTATSRCATRSAMRTTCATC